MSGTDYPGRDVSTDEQEEDSIELLSGEGHYRLERIVSPPGYSSPEAFWYDQSWDEWVIVVEGSAELRFEDGEVAKLHRGDCLVIPSGRRHRVQKTAKDVATVWIALHMGVGSSQ